MEPVREVENKKRKFKNDEDDEAGLQQDDNAQLKKTKVHSNTPVADVLIFGSGEQGNQLPLELCAKVKFRRKPALIKQFEDTKIRQICAVGYQTAVLIDRDSEQGLQTELYTWGCSDDGFLGRIVAQEQPDKDRDESTPAKVPVEGLVSICAGSYHMCGLTADGRLYGWGAYRDENGFLGFLNDSEQAKKQMTPLQITFFDTHLKRGEKLIALASSFNTTLGLTSLGKVFEWGAQHQRVQRKSDREVVRENERRKQLNPVQTRLAGIKAIYAGGDVHFAIHKNGDVWGWGINGFGQLGGGDTVTHEIPIKLKGFPANIVQIACGQSHSLLLTEAGEVYSFGRNAYGQLGHGEDEPAPEKGSERALVSRPKLIQFFSQMPDGEVAIKVAAGDQHSAVVTNKGSLYTFGFGEQYRLGNCTDPGDEEEDVLSPYKVTSAQIDVRAVTQVSCATDHTVIVARKK